MLTQEKLKSLLHYNPETGEFVRIKSYFKTQIGTTVGNVDKSTGYLQTELFGEKCYLHRLAFLYMEGKIPLYVDHINRNRSDNRWSNLREATSNQNAHNSSIRSHNTTGVKGVALKENRAYQAGVTLNKKQYKKTFSFSSYPSKEAALVVAEKWVIAKREELHQNFCNHT